jgi:alkylhydroperoxidase family enzyme
VTTPPPALRDDSRIPCRAELSPEAEADMAEARRLGTPNPYVYRIFDHHPELRRTFTEHWRAIFDDGIADRDLKELARRRIANAIACVTCTSVAVPAGSIEEKLAASYSWRDSDVLDVREKAVLWLLDILMGWDDDVDGAYRAMNEQFSPAEVLELGWFIAFNAGTIPFVRSWGLHVPTQP